MPAKGWRKDEQESNLDTAIANEGQSIDNYLFPKATLNKLSKQVLTLDNENFIMAKDTQTVIQRSSVLFINYIYHTAKQLVKMKNRKVVNSDDIINALNILGFNNFELILNNELDKFNSKKEAKKLAKLKLKEDLNTANNKDVDLDSDLVNNNSTSNKRLKLNKDNISSSTIDDTLSENDTFIVNKSNLLDNLDNEEIESVDKIDKIDNSDTNANQIQHTQSDNESEKKN